ncbi:hypothetical protein GCM10009001_22260 [Virgibacillus siamensis]|uniref:Uncharacterized protein n=1 Tax=Virgibacillus siamensis TaxID=480071 RepID=A0ABP3R6X0_9BACI
MWTIVVTSVPNASIKNSVSNGVISVHLLSAPSWSMEATPTTLEKSNLLCFSL